MSRHAQVATDEQRAEVERIVREVVYPADQAYLDELRGEYRARQPRGARPLVGARRRRALSHPDPGLDDAPARSAGSAPDRRRRARADRGGAPRDRPVRRASATTRVAYRGHLPPTRDNQAKTRQEIVERAKEDIERAIAVAPRYFGKLPTVGCDVRPVEEYKEADAPFAYYYPPSVDGSRPGIYFVNTYDLPSRTFSKLATTTYHEATPGHHFQIALEMEHPELPAFRRLGSRMVGGAYVEGWGLYARSSPARWACSATRPSASACSMRWPGARPG